MFVGYKVVFFLCFFLNCILKVFVVILLVFGNVCNFGWSSYMREINKILMLVSVKMSWLLNIFVVYLLIKELIGIVIVFIFCMIELMWLIYWFGIIIWLIVVNNMLVVLIGI